MKAIKSAMLGLFGITGVVVSMFGIKVPFAESLAKEHWRAGVVALLIVILLVPAAIGLFLYLVDANRFKGEIVQYVKTQTQRDLVLQGELKVTFFPEFGLEAAKMSLSQRNSAREFASINSARFHIAWWPLFQKSLVIKRAEFDGVHANLVRFRDGTTNFDDLLVRNETLSPVTLDIDGLRITNSAINWQDEIKWQRIALQDVQIETGRLADAVPSRLSASFHVNSEMLHSDSTIELKSRLFYDRKAVRYEFADIEGKLDGTVAGFSNLDLNFKGSLDSRPALGTLVAENVVVTGTGNYGQRNIEAKLGVPKLQFAKGTLNGSQLTLDTALSQFDEKWTTSVQMPVFEYANQVFSAAELSAGFDFKGEGRTLHGKLSGPFSVDYAKNSMLQLTATALELIAKHPMLAGGLPVKAAGGMNADLAERNIYLDLKGKLDDSGIAGNLAIKDYSHPEYTFDFNANRLDLDRYISADWIRRYRDDATQLDFGGIKNLTLNGHLHADEFKAARLKAARLDADIKVDQDTLAASLAASLYGGTWSGSLSVDAKATQQVALRQNLKNVRMDALLGDTAGTDKLAGKAEVALELSAEGVTVGAMRKTLEGDILLALGRGSVAGIDLRTALLEGKDDLGTQNAAHVREAKFSERTDFSELKAAFNFKDGASRSNSLELKSPLFHVTGEGEFTPENGNIDYRLGATVASTLNRRSAGDLAEMKGVTVPVRVSGPYASPAIALDFAAASGDIVTRRIAAKAAAEQAAIKAAQLEAEATAKSAAPVKKKAARTGKK